MSIYGFGPFLLDPAARQLTLNGREVAMPGKAWQILMILVEAQGRFVSHETLRAELWPNIAVEDRTLTVHVSTLRKALRDGTFSDYIENVPRAGYRLAASVRILSGVDAEVVSRQFTATPEPPAITWSEVPVPHDSSSHLVDVTTENVPARERLDFWRETVLRRNRPDSPVKDQPFRAHLRRIAIEDAELVEHASEAVVVLRSSSRPHFDGGDDIALELMRDGTTAWHEHNGEHDLRPGDLYVVDYSRPRQIMRPRHRAAGIVLSRRRVMDVVGEDLSQLAGRALPTYGLAAVLRQHMAATLDHSPAMRDAERIVAVRAAAEMGLAILRTCFGAGTDAGRTAGGLYAAVLALIERQCLDPELTPVQLALKLGCSLDSLDQAFTANDDNVADRIWDARLDYAWKLLSSAPREESLASAVALRCGFRELATFTRMFKRRFGVAPTEAHEAAADD
jgi:DNA-binding winged helix-turn-helix (wHTH) protein/AraC-like DNA-binding protein